MTVSYYIYYRVAPARAAQADAAARKLLQRVQDVTGVAGTLKRKRGEDQLWMEIYERVSDEAAFEWALAEAFEASGLRTCLQADSQRHTECFRD
jgi:hypothetical protein